jgi:hypothetical protein
VTAGPFHEDVGLIGMPPALEDIGEICGGRAGTRVPKTQLSLQYLQSPSIEQFRLSEATLSLMESSPMEFGSYR